MNSPDPVFLTCTISFDDSEFLSVNTTLLVAHSFASDCTSFEIKSLLLEYSDIGHGLWAENTSSPGPKQAQPLLGILFFQVFES